MVTVTFKFNEDKLRKIGKTVDEMLNPFRKDLEPYKVQEIAQGSFQKDGKDGLVVLDFPLVYIRKHIEYLELLDVWNLNIDGKIEDCKKELIAYYEEHNYELGA